MMGGALPKYFLSKINIAPRRDWVHCWCCFLGVPGCFGSTIGGAVDGEVSLVERVVTMVKVLMVIRRPLSHPLHLVDGEGALRRLLLMASAPVDLHIICYHLSFYIIVYNNLLRFKFQIVIIGFASDTTVFVIGLNIVIIISTAWSPECRAGPYQQHRPHWASLQKNRSQLDLLACHYQKQIMTWCF